MKSFCLESSQKFGSVHSVSTEAFHYTDRSTCVYVCLHYVFFPISKNHKHKKALEINSPPLKKAQHIKVNSRLLFVCYVRLNLTTATP